MCYIIIYVYALIEFITANLAGGGGIEYIADLVGVQHRDIGGVRGRMAVIF